MKRFEHRQMLFDFHTSGDIRNVGELFDAERFGSSLEKAGVEKITVFSKCHHSWCYYPTKIGVMHPHLKRDLCGDMVRAAKAKGIGVALYFPVGWSEGDADRHPEWVARERDGSVSASGKFDFDNADPNAERPTYLWKQLCINGGYREYCLAMIREIAERYPEIDGLFIDIMFRYTCYCPKCIAEMRKAGVDIDDAAAAKRFYDEKWLSFAEEIKAVLHERIPDAEIFFNGGADMNSSFFHGTHTHVEIEDLPTAWGGYDKMPLTAKYFHRRGAKYLGLTAKFHAAWGEFGGYKNREALRYEIAAMMAFGAGASIGDQMHPLGYVEEDTFNNVAYAYDYAARIDEYCYDAEETARLGVVLTFDPEIDEGVSKVLLEAHLDFDIVLSEDDLSRFDVVILPEGISLNEARAKLYNEYMRGGGKLLIVGKSGLDPDGKKFLLDIPLIYDGESSFNNDFIRLGDGFAADLVRAPFLCYTAAHRVTPKKGAKTLAYVHEPYFNRTVKRFCSHCVTPYKPEVAEYPAAVCGDNFVYIAHDIFGMYRSQGAQLHRDYILRALGLLYTDPVLEVELPSTGRVRLTRQKDKNRLVLHLLYGPPISRGNCQVLEDFPEIRDTRVKIRTEKTVARVVLQPQGKPLEFTRTEDGIEFCIPAFRLHQIVSIEEQ